MTPPYWCYFLKFFISHPFLQGLNRVNVWLRSIGISLKWIFQSFVFTTFRARLKSFWWMWMRLLLVETNPEAQFHWHQMLCISDGSLICLEPQVWWGCECSFQATSHSIWMETDPCSCTTSQASVTGTVTFQQRNSGNSGLKHLPFLNDKIHYYHCLNSLRFWKIMCETKSPWWVWGRLFYSMNNRKHDASSLQKFRMTIICHKTCWQ